MKSAIAATLSVLLAIGAAFEASAQSFPHQAGRMRQQLEDGQILVQASRSLNVPTNDGDDMDAKRAEATKSLYRMAERECPLLLDTIAESCTLASLSTNVSEGESSSTRGLRLSVNYTMTVKLRSDPKP